MKKEASFSSLNFVDIDAILVVIISNRHRIYGTYMRGYVKVSTRKLSLGVPVGPGSEYEVAAIRWK